MSRPVAEIVKADEIMFSAYYGGWRPTTPHWVGYAAMKGELIAAFGGLIEVEEGRWVAFLDIPAPQRRKMLVRVMKKGLEEAKAMGCRIVDVSCNYDIPRSEALLRFFGFQKTDRTYNGKVIWCLALN